MSNEILSVLEYMEKEKGIPRTEMIGAITSAIKTAAQKGLRAGQELRVDVDARSGKLSVFSQLKVVDSVSDPKLEIHIEKARAIQPGAQVGDVVESPVKAEELGRIAAQAARQGIMQRVRQFEKDRIFEEYKDQVGDIVSGIVRRRERGDLVVDLGRAEALMPVREQVPGEAWSAGDRLRALLLAIESTPRGPEVILSRANHRFVRRLFELEVTEVADGTVYIQLFARDPGYRTKVAVATKDGRVDPVGACVGARGSRVKNIVRELGGEKIDIMEYHEDPRKMITEALKPAKTHNVRVQEKERRIHLEVAEEDLALAIGKQGKNARLTSKLLGWRLEIDRLATGQQRGFEHEVKVAAGAFAQIAGVTPEMAQRLVDMGVTGPEMFTGEDAVTEEDLVANGFEPAEAATIIQAVRSRAAAGPA